MEAETVDRIKAINWWDRLPHQEKEKIVYLEYKSVLSAAEIKQHIKDKDIINLYNKR